MRIRPRLDLTMLAASMVMLIATILPLATFAAEQSRHAHTAFDNAAVHYRTMAVDGVNIFYREAGATDAPVLLLLHGFPSSSNMYRALIPRLSDRYRVIAPDYPGFGLSDAPDRSKFKYTFAHYAELVDSFLATLHIDRYALYVMDYGAPVGYRLALLHPERVTALVVQNGNAYTEGLKDFWKPIQAYWASGSKANRDALKSGMTLAATRSQYVDGVKDPTRIDPTAWLFDQSRLDRPGNEDIQLDLFYDYRTNVELYPRFQAFFRQQRPPTLLVWAANDVIFPAEGARAYLRDLPDAELHLLDSGHFALEDKGAEIASLMRDFLNRKIKRK